MNGEHEVLFIDECSHTTLDYLLQPCGSQLGRQIKGAKSCKIHTYSLQHVQILACCNADPWAMTPSERLCYAGG